MPTPIYHITHIGNLEGMCSSGRIRCKNRNEEPYVSIAHANIQDRRSTKRVSCGPGGVLHDYVPFYFAPKSPMLYAISRGNVVGYAGDQNAVIYLVSSIETIQERGRQFVFTDGHAVMYSAFYEDLAHLDQVDWPLMGARMWCDTEADPDRCRRRQAEFLVYHELNMQGIESIGVANAEVRGRARRILDAHDLATPVTIQRGWYY
jgi:hypothetical protein